MTYVVNDGGYEDVFVRASLNSQWGAPRQRDALPTIWGQLAWASVAGLNEGTHAGLAANVARALTRAELDGQCFVLASGHIVSADRVQVLSAASAGPDRGKPLTISIDGAAYASEEFSHVRGVMDRDRVREACNAYSRAIDLTLAGMERSQQPVHKIPDLGRLLQTPSGQQAVEKRIELVDAARGIRNTVVIDAAEDYTILSAQMSAASAAIDAAMTRVAAVSGVPRRIVFGEAASSALSSGGSDSEQWERSIERYRATRVNPLVLFLTGKPASYAPPTTETAAERGKRLSDLSQALDRLLTHGVIGNTAARALLAAEGFDVSGDHEQ